MMSRDVLAAPVTVENAAQLTVSVQITTISLADIYPDIPTVGALGSGGIYIGQYDYTYTSESPGSHRKYGLILAPVAGGESAGVVWRNPAADTSTANKSYYGSTNTDVLIALGADSPLGQWVASVNAGALGGYADWYVPGYAELNIMYTNRASIPAGEECTSANYWTSTYNSGIASYVRNPITGAGTSVVMTNSLKCRLIRRILITDWTPV